MNISQRIIELEKGCRKGLGIFIQTFPICCGDMVWDEVRNIKEKYLCPTCQVKLQLLKEIKEDVLKEREMTAIQLLNIIQPEHSRTSCSDTNLQNGFYSNEGYTRCFRCTILEIIRKGYLPKSHYLTTDFCINDKEAKKELKQNLIGESK